MKLRCIACAAAHVEGAIAHIGESIPSPAAVISAITLVRRHGISKVVNSLCLEHGADLADAERAANAKATG